MPARTPGSPITSWTPAGCASSAAPPATGRGSAASSPSSTSSRTRSSRWAAGRSARPTSTPTRQATAEILDLGPARRRPADGCIRRRATASTRSSSAAARRPGSARSISTRSPPPRGSALGINANLVDLRLDDGLRTVTQGRCSAPTRRTMPASPSGRARLLPLHRRHRERPAAAQLRQPDARAASATRTTRSAAISAITVALPRRGAVREPRGAEEDSFFTPTEAFSRPRTEGPRPQHPLPSPAAAADVVPDRGGAQRGVQPALRRRPGS